MRQGRQKPGNGLCILTNPVKALHLTKNAGVAACPLLNVRANLLLQMIQKPCKLCQLMPGTAEDIGDRDKRGAGIVLQEGLAHSTHGCQESGMMQGVA